MFHLFKKNSDPEKALPFSQHLESLELGESYEPEEFTILAVTGPKGFRRTKSRGQELWKAGANLTAWRKENEAIQTERAYLEVMADDDLQKRLKKHAPGDSVIRVRVRQSGDGKRFMMVGMPARATDAELQAVLEEAKKPVTFSEEGLGTFTLNRYMEYFEAEVDWLGTKISLNFDQDENRDDCIRNAKSLLAAQEEWNWKIREFAADELLEIAREWAEETDEDEDEEENLLSREQFMECMEPSVVEVSADGAFDFWFGDGDMFYGHSIRVWGSLEKGPTDASMEG